MRGKSVSDILRENFPNLELKVTFDVHPPHTAHIWHSGSQSQNEDIANVLKDIIPPLKEYKITSNKT